MSRSRDGRTSQLRSLAKRVSWGLADQAVSSLTNFAVGILVARNLDPADFGVFALVWATYGLVLSISRGLVSEPFVVRFNGAPDALRLPALGRATGCAVGLGLATGVLCAAGGLIVGGSLGHAFVALGVVMPGLLLQDAWRFGFFAAGQGRSAFANDMAWAVALVPFMALAIVRPSVAAFVLAWGVAAAAAAAVGVVQAHLLPRPASGPGWLSEQRDLGGRYVLEALSSGASSQVRLYGLGLLAGLAAVGDIRGAELLIGPFMAVLMGVSIVAVPEAARVLRRNPGRLARFCALLGTAQATAALVWGVGLLVVVPPDRLAELLGPVGPAAVPLVLPATLAITLASFSSGAMIGLRALAAARRSLRAQVAESTLYVIASLIGAVLGGARGSSWGAACACLIGVAVWWGQLRAATRTSSGDGRQVSRSGRHR